MYVYYISDIGDGTLISIHDKSYSHPWVYIESNIRSSLS